VHVNFRLQLYVYVTNNTWFLEISYAWALNIYCVNSVSELLRIEGKTVMKSICTFHKEKHLDDFKDLCEGFTEGIWCQVFSLQSTQLFFISVTNRPRQLKLNNILKSWTQSTSVHICSHICHIQHFEGIEWMCKKQQQNVKLDVALIM
jgi:hypothetical protein